MRLSLEKKDNQKLQQQLEELREQIREFEGKVANLNIEVAKKSQKITQGTTTTSILQTQVERLRLEMEEEKLASEREISHLNALLSEKNTIIEKYKSELGIEKDHKGDSEFGLETTANFDSIFENDFESMFESTFSNLNMDALNRAQEENQARDPHLSPRALIASEARLDPDQMCSQMAMFLKKKAEDPATEPTKTSTLEKATQTKEEVSKDPPAALISLPQDKKTISELTEENRALTEKCRAASEEVAEKVKLIDLYKSHIQQREAIVDALTEKLVKVSEENSQTINDINSEYMSLLQKYMLLKKH